MGSAGPIKSFPKAESSRLLKPDIIIPIVVWRASTSSRCVTGKRFPPMRLPSFAPRKSALMRLDHKCSSRKQIQIFMDPGIGPAPRIRASVGCAVRIQ